MKIHLRKKKNKYAQVHENLLRNPDISLKAKGLGAWLELHENGFVLNLSFILQSTKEGKEAINSAISELKGGKYLFIEKSRNEKGQFIADWHYDSEGMEPYTDFPYMDNPQKDNPVQEKLPQNIKSKPKKINKKISSSKKENFNDFRKRIKALYLGESLVSGPKGYLAKTVISVSDTGYLHNEFSGKDLVPSDAIELWQWLYANQNKLLRHGGNNNEV